MGAIELNKVEKWFGKYKPEVPARKPLGPQFKPFTKQLIICVKKRVIKLTSNQDLFMTTTSQEIKTSYFRNVAIRI